MKSLVYSFLAVFLILPHAIRAQSQYSVFHQEHIGEIVFCNKPILLGKEKEQNIKQTFVAGEKIYAMAYFKKPFNEIADKRFIGFRVWLDQQKKKITFSKPGVKKRFAYYRIFNQYVDKPHHSVEIIPSKDQATNEIEVEGWTRFLKSIEPGNHKLKIQMRHPGGVLAEGTLHLQWKNFNPDQFEKRMNEIVKAISTSHAKSTKLPDVFKQKSTRKFVDPAMSKDRIKFILLMSDEFNNAEDFRRVVVGNGSDWKILRDDETGKPKYKVNDRPVRVIYKGKDGWCYYVKKVFFARKYIESGEYEDPKFVKATEHQRINCRNIK